MAVFPKIADLAHYDPNEYEFSADPPALEYWLDVFTQQIENVAHHAVESAGNGDEAQRRADDGCQEFRDFLAQLRRDPRKFAPISLMTFDRRRDEIMHAQGFPDTHAAVKAKENELAMPLLPGVFAEIDALPESQRLPALVRGIFAGNIFDLGVLETIKLFHSGGVDFHATREKLPPRPWLVDDYDRLAARWNRCDSVSDGWYKKAAMMVDNAGADVVLGMLPFAREFLRRGTQVILAANTRPSLNDITIAELTPLVDQVCEFDAIYRAARKTGQLIVMGTGIDLPLLDLTKVSAEYADACRDIDLLVLEGMGRSTETNYSTRFTCDCLKIAMAKDAFVAKRLGGKVMDVVCRFEEA